MCHNIRYTLAVDYFKATSNQCQNNIRFDIKPPINNKFVHLCLIAKNSSVTKYKIINPTMSLMMKYMVLVIWQENWWVNRQG